MAARWFFCFLFLSSAPAAVVKPHSYLRRDKEETLVDMPEFMLPRRLELNVAGLVEKMDCIPWDEVAQAIKDHPQGERGDGGDGTCGTGGSCGSGNEDSCCRIHQYLLCDSGNGLPQLQCVCNSNTRPRNSFSGWTVTAGGSTIQYVGDPLAGTSSAQGNAPLEANVGKPGGGTGNDKDKKKGKSKTNTGNDGPVAQEANAGGCPVGKVCINGVPIVRPPPSGGTGSNGGSTGTGPIAQEANVDETIPRVPADYCAHGGWFTNMAGFAENTLCNQTEGMCRQSAGECCLAAFCMCGPPKGDIAGRCVPPFDYDLLAANA